MHACHKTGDSYDNQPGKLYWGTPRENFQDQVKHGKAIHPPVAFPVNSMPYVAKIAIRNASGPDEVQMIESVASQWQRANCDTPLHESKPPRLTESKFFDLMRLERARLRQEIANL